MSVLGCGYTRMNSDLISTVFLWPGIIYVSQPTPKTILLGMEVLSQEHIMKRSARERSTKSSRWVGDREPRNSQTLPSFLSLEVFSLGHEERLRSRVGDRLVHYNCSEMGYIAFRTYWVTDIELHRTWIINEVGSFDVHDSRKCVDNLLYGLTGV